MMLLNWNATKAISLLAALFVISSCTAEIQKGRVSDTLSNGNFGTAEQLDNTQPLGEPISNLSVSFPKIIAKESTIIEVLVRNESEVPIIQSEYAIMVTASFVVAPKSVDKLPLDLLIKENAETRLFGLDDLFVETIPSIESRTERKLVLGKIELKKTLANFNNIKLSPGHEHLNVCVLVLHAFAINRSGEIMSKNECFVDLQN